MILKDENHDLEEYSRMDLEYSRMGLEHSDELQSSFGTAISPSCMIIHPKTTYMIL